MDEVSDPRHTSYQLLLSILWANMDKFYEFYWYLTYVVRSMLHNGKFTQSKKEISTITFAKRKGQFEVTNYLNNNFSDELDKVSWAFRHDPLKLRIHWNSGSKLQFSLNSIIDKQPNSIGIL